MGKMSTGQRLAVVIPKIEQSPSSKSSDLNNIQKTTMNDSKPASRPALAPEEQNGLDPEPPIDPGLLESEMELVSSLAKLQKLEEMVHQLRTLLPERLLEPLAPIINPRAAAVKGVPESPQKLFELLSQAARAGVSEVGEFQGMWRGRELKPVWERVDTLIYENAGRLLQPNGVWERDYDEILEEITKQDTARKEQQQKAKEEEERSQLQSAEGGWQAVVDSFAQRNIPRVRVLPTKEDSSFYVVLAKVGLAFKIYTVGGQNQGLPDWTVSTKSASLESASRLETAVLDCLNSRPRKWDLTFLLEMTSSYTDIFQTPCTKCGNMQDTSSNLPTIRRAKPINSSTDLQPPTFEAFHTTCI